MNRTKPWLIDTPYVHPILGKSEIYFYCDFIGKLTKKPNVLISQYLNISQLFRGLGKFEYVGEIKGSIYAKMVAIFKDVCSPT